MIFASCGEVPAMQENDTGGRGWGVTFCSYILLRRLTQTTVTFEGLHCIRKILHFVSNFASCGEVPASQENDTGGRGWGFTFEGLTAFAKFLASLQNFASCCEVPASQE